MEDKILFRLTFEKIVPDSPEYSQKTSASVDITMKQIIEMKNNDIAFNNKILQMLYKNIDKQLINNEY